MEYVIGPALALLLSGGGIYLSGRKHRIAEENLLARVEIIENTVRTIDKEVPKRMVTLIAPVAAAVKQVKQEIGVE